MTRSQPATDFRLSAGSAALQISRTTVENAYNQLVADGYLQNEPKRGYFAAALSGLIKHSDAPVTQSIEPPAVRYNFANNYIDPASFPSSFGGAI